nr:GFA family protein [Bdellovibrio bacteriovorus]
MGTCYCSRCRKAGASLMVFVQSEDIKWIQGKELVASYRPEPPFTYVRNFCSRCGTSLGEILSQEKSFPLAANCLDDDPGVRNTFYEHMESKPAWYEN